MSAIHKKFLGGNPPCQFMSKIVKSMSVLTRDFLKMMNFKIKTYFTPSSEKLPTFNSSP